MRQSLFDKIVKENEKLYKYLHDKDEKDFWNGIKDFYDKKQKIKRKNKKFLGVDIKSNGLRVRR